ncbi:MAG TPA: endosialidase, partial [Candidatus Alectryocaccobium stercorigallinarum]|nr:endosialidase [Candidatus Alectryocaccobium stercorigallinarum]
DGVQFSLEGSEDVQITLDLNEDAEYEIEVNNETMGMMKTNISGKLSFGIELENETPVQVNIRQI